ncbi:MAG: glutaredoxin-like protein [Candidatus Falkowbacteria bacterium GW2011_GWC2_38_22]|uniref:Glutaredoxin-like protein n=1 Tax=Candidatus Falkowbacteria bacterium GW2011_GWE1_38_31 TaxID=1618638 RepID=A0A0G0M6W7_9BACT|nr:MAG: glutaredoxin-like protein [Candidatus Falkowbacteria bacterium GW2011_GWF2_38_1205]KKQ60465.1 MAG: glutaredoxin-like protein [Candidatus Falkowbacteria bacterium GW2011_GWC2_38_22]KKQ62526.1 MAG: glutaredoxin-like protein [Candidatus Falkowbacteria bacterium GW2011_GWF1_38_22]KKQ64587.1 MAG: glutaredoxin-like protein [Candidatus Falkowbacteria bacterium GW2011_GWE2_38_254]KKQ69419.1 MAG: glutaredoxin-like protein [Candidatus Falkowbacteria bacterium GW2011_GWE1_38_31]KKQ71879.1 MAG: gl
MEKYKNIIVYSSPDCAYCYTLKEYLKSKDVAYGEANIYDDVVEYENMKKFSGQDSVPVLFCDGKFVIGWDKEKVNELLGL